MRGIDGPRETSRRLPPWLLRFGPLVVTLVLGAVLCVQIGPALREFLFLNWQWVAKALGVSLVGNVAVASCKLWMLLRWMGISTLSLWGTHRMILGLLALSFFAPFQSGHLLYVAALARLAGIPIARAFEIIVLDKWLTVCATGAWMALGGLLVPEGHPLAGPLWTAAAMILASSPWWLRPVRPILLRIPRVGETFRLISRPLPNSWMLCLMALAVIYQSTDILATCFGARALGVEVPWATATAIVPPVIFATWIPISVSGIGVREHLLAHLLGDELERRVGLQMGVLVDFTEYLAPALVGLTALPCLLRALAEPGGRGGLR